MHYWNSVFVATLRCDLTPSRILCSTRVFDIEDGKSVPNVYQDVIMKTFYRNVFHLILPDDGNNRIMGMHNFQLP